MKIRKTEKEDFGDISEEDDINQSPSLKQKKWKIMAKLKDSGGGMVADIFSDELSLEALSNIKYFIKTIFMLFHF